ncbi:hypothetical protein [Pseudonocardia oroxyli]|uniref:hypothetical protein n=1 Tax=Pseudonocardia oroxyli TaxID=366584 RepID=UPI000B82AE22|nr:hypothetical protein [Pseudonocardia oroxyli]
MNRLVAEYPAIVGPVGGRGSAVTWFRDAWPHLDAVHRESADGRTVAMAMMLLPFLVEIEDWAGLCEVAGRGIAANPEEEDIAVRLRQAVAAGLQRSGRYAEARVVLEGLLEQATAAGDEGARAAEIAVGGDPTSGGVLHAVTSTAQLQDDADAAHGMERAALQAMSLAAAHATGR